MKFTHLKSGISQEILLLHLFIKTPQQELLPGKEQLKNITGLLGRII